MTSHRPIAFGDTLSSGSIKATIAPDLSLRGITVAGHRALDAVIFSTRNAQWDTGAVVVEAFEGAHTDDGFSVCFRCRHHANGLDMQWTGGYRASNGVVEATIDGTATTSQSLNRAGFTVLHPIELRGHRVDVSTLDGGVVRVFGDRIDPEVVFTEVTSMVEHLSEGVRLEITFLGDTFETEDHRNWTDAGWKTYCTPLSHPAPRRLRPGDSVRQTVLLRPAGALDGCVDQVVPQASSAATLTVAVGSPNGGRLPILGSGVSDIENLPAEAVDAIRALGLEFLHVELVDGDDDVGRFERAAREALELGLPLRLGLVTDRDHLDEWAGRIAASRIYIQSVSIFDVASNSSSEALVEAFARRLSQMRGSPSSPWPRVGGGTRGYFAELNRLRDLVPSADYVEYSITPQVHHSDDELVFDTVLAQADTVRDARILAGGRPVRVGPVTMRQRLNVHLLPPRPLPIGDVAGPDVDQRQHERFAAVWTLGAVAALADAESVTLFRTAGLRGIVPLVPRGSNTSGARALHAVLISLAAAAGWSSVALQISSPRTLVGLAATIPGGGTRVWLGNRTADFVRFEVSGAQAPRAMTLPAWHITTFDIRQDERTVKSN